MANGLPMTANCPDFMRGKLLLFEQCADPLGGKCYPVLLGNCRTGNLVLADPNEEGASLLALNTRQQLSQTALSLANQADQGVLRLFG